MEKWQWKRFRFYPHDIIKSIDICFHLSPTMRERLQTHKYVCRNTVLGWIHIAFLLFCIILCQLPPHILFSFFHTLTYLLRLSLSYFLDLSFYIFELKSFFQFLKFFHPLFDTFLLWGDFSFTLSTSMKVLLTPRTYRFPLHSRSSK